MHQSSIDKMRAFRDKYLSGREQEALVILDLGSQDVNPLPFNYRLIFSEPLWRYIGLDMARGVNVDTMLKNPYVWREVSTNFADVLVSGQAFEHIEYFWITMLEVFRVLKPGGLCCLVAPSSGPEHRYPVDCWRFYPDGMAAVARFAQLEVICASTQWENMGYSDGSDIWHDSVLICRKPQLGAWSAAKARARCFLQHCALTLGQHKVRLANG
jgi:SAM-dependent methyltransferase